MSEKFSPFWGKFIAIEGTDGSGKETQSKKLVSVFNNKGIDTELLSFPRYQTPTGNMVARFLHGEFGDATNIHPYLSSYLFTADRLAASRHIRTAKKLGKLVIADRFTGSNMAYQGAKITDRTERIKFYRYLIKEEFEKFDIPRPSKNFVLFISRSIARVRMAERSSVVIDGLDDNERNSAYQDRVADVYEELCELFPDWFIPIDCMDNTGNQGSKDQIATRLYEKALKELDDE